MAGGQGDGDIRSMLREDSVSDLAQIKSITKKEGSVLCRSDQGIYSEPFFMRVFWEKI